MKDLDTSLMTGLKLTIPTFQLVRSLKKPKHAVHEKDREPPRITSFTTHKLACTCTCYISTKRKLPTESDEGQPSPTSELFHIIMYIPQLHNCSSSKTCTKYKVSRDEDLDSELQDESCYCVQSGVNCVSGTERDWTIQSIWELLVETPIMHSNVLYP